MLLIAIVLSGVTVFLKERADVRGAEIEVADVADVSGADAELVERVRHASLGWAPAPGFSRWFDAQRVDAELERVLPEITVDVRGAEGCRAWPQIERVRGAAIEAAARAELERWTAGRDVELSLTAHVADVEAPSGDTPNELRAVLSVSDLRAGALDVPVRVLVDGAPHRTVWTRWNVEMWETASVPVRAIRAGETIAADALQTKRVRSKGAQPVNALALIGSIATRDLPVGEAIVEAQLARPTLVTPGAALMLEVRRGSVSARISVVADQAGKQGERIRVAQPGTQRSWQATVVARDLVSIDLEVQ